MATCNWCLGHHHIDTHRVEMGTAAWYVCADCYIATNPCGEAQHESQEMQSDREALL